MSLVSSQGASEGLCTGEGPAHRDLPYHLLPAPVGGDFHSTLLTSTCSLWSSRFSLETLETPQALGSDKLGARPCLAACCVTLSKSLHLSEPRFSSLKNEANNPPPVRGPGKAKGLRSEGIKK